ncbi:reverse transcriptase [Senna tora]|uniref:Reverse transcriptase n=1 Tax=Senna tora TaxID=362788 RepID=A0A835CG44_9FABA|nr:reverse transcriptase [Senna tora]
MDKGKLVEGEVLELEAEEIVAKRGADHQVVGTILSGKLFNKKLVKNVMTKAWGELAGLTIMDLGVNSFLFSFESEELARRVLNGGVAFHEINFKLVPFWVQAHGLPLEQINHKNAERIGGKIGQVLLAENPRVNDKLVKSFVRVRVFVDVSKPLVTGFWAPRKDGPEVWVFLKYEKLIDMCFNCGIVGHEQKHCKSQKMMAVWDPSLPRYGLALSVPPAKSMTAILSELEIQQKKEDSSSEKSSGRGLLYPIRATEGSSGLGKKANQKENEGTTRQSTEYGASPKGEGSVGHGVSILPNESLTKIRLRDGKVSAGLGPRNLEDIGLEKEFIGLNEEVVIVDINSPVKSGEDPSMGVFMHEGIQLSKKEAQRCKEVIRTKKAQDIQEFTEKAIRSQKYYVELPSEEEETEKIPSPKTQRATTELAEKLKKRLDLKRGRDDPKEKTTSKLLIGNGEQDEEMLEEVDDDVFTRETKARNKKVEALRRKLKFDNVFVVEAVGKSGGLALFWKNRCVVQILDSCLNFIHTAIEVKGQDNLFLMTFIYGHPEFSDRRHLWPVISNLVSNGDTPWGCIGDFNEILSQSEKDGVRPHSNLQIEVFRDFLANSGLQDMDLKGCRFTWCNNREEGCVRERIDRCVTNGAWRRVFSLAWLEAIPALESDHTPLILRFFNHGQRTNRTFKFEQYWLENEQCIPLIRESLGREFMPNCFDAISQKIAVVSKDLQEWDQNTFKRADKEITRLKKKLGELSNADFVEGKMEQIKELKHKIADLRKQEEQFWEARARVKWLRSGDKNTRFFHATTLQRSFNRIAKIQMDNGEWEIEESRIREVFSGYYSNLFTSNSPPDSTPSLASFPSRISEEMNADLLKQVTLEELKEAVFSLGALKAPGPDGLNGLFFQKSWDFVKDDLLAAANFFMEGNLFPHNFNETHITLVPKIPNPSSVGDFRPISCYNFSYKIFSKILANRMKALLPSIVSEVQSGFMGGRLIQDNITVVQEVFHHLKKKSSKSKDFFMALKIDMNKAYDRLEWGFVCSTLRAMDINIWDDFWLPNHAKIPYSQSLDRNSKVSTLMLPSGEGWDVSKVMSLFDSVIAEHILSIPLSRGGGRDFIVWSFNSNGIYSVKSGYWVALNASFHPGGAFSSFNIDSSLWKWIWNLGIPPKVKNFLWRLCSNALPSLNNLSKRRIVLSPRCQICNQEEESIEHIFLMCPWTRPVWFGSRFQWNFNNAQVSRMDIWIWQKLKQIRAAGGNWKENQAHFAMLIWKIWKGRNKFYFEQVVINPSLTIQLAAEKALECENCVSIFPAPPVVVNSVPSPVPFVRRWREEGWYRCNVDAATLESSNVCASAFLLRDDHGSLLTGSSRKFWASSPLIAEALALRESIFACMSLDLQKVHFESDCKVLTDAILLNDVPWIIDPIVADINQALAEHPSFVIHWVPRSLNTPADWVARAALRRSLPPLWTSSPPEELRRLLLLNY